MKVDYYVSSKNPKKFLLVPAGTDMKTKAFPADLDMDLRQLHPMRQNDEINPGEARIGLNSDDVLKQIEDKGFATFQVEITVEVRTDPPR